MSKYQVRWGILATGGIAETFARDLFVDPQTRGVTDIVHRVVAAASSSSLGRAKQFLDTVWAPEAKAYGSYRELVADPDVDIVYVATPHSHHYQNVMLCLEAGKPVLCEKAFTANAAQTEVWTRYFPLSHWVRDTIRSGAIGPVSRVFADNSIGSLPETSFADTHRMVNPDLAGGALLDLGIYSLTWVFQTLYSLQPHPRAPSVLAMMRKYKLGTDEQTTMLLDFPRDCGSAHAIATTGMRTASDPSGRGEVGPAVRVQGERGEIQVWPPIYRPTRTRLIRSGDGDGGDAEVQDRQWPQPGPGAGSGFYNGFAGAWNAEGEGHGMFWEADECARALREGRKESAVQPLTESLAIMRVMDEVRRQGDMKLPDKIETTEYPVEL